MSYFIAVLIIIAVNIVHIFRSVKPEKSTVIFMSRTDRESIRKMNKLKNMGMAVFFAGKTNMINALKKGVMKKGDLFVTEREFEMLSEDEKERLISFCRLYLEVSDVSKIKRMICEKYDAVDIKDADIQKFYGKSALAFALDFILLTEISVAAAVITHKIVMLLL